MGRHTNSRTSQIWRYSPKSPVPCHRGQLSQIWLLPYESVMNSLYQNKTDKSETFKYDRNRTTCSLHQAHIFKSITVWQREGESKLIMKRLLVVFQMTDLLQKHLDNIVTLLCVLQGHISTFGSESKMKSALWMKAKICIFLFFPFWRFTCIIKTEKKKESRVQVESN